MTEPGISVYPIRTEADHHRAVDRIAELMASERDAARTDELDILATLVNAYESSHFPMEPPTPVEAIAFGMEQQGLTKRDLESFLGDRTNLTEVLSGKRKLTLGMIRRLQHGLGIPADVLIGSVPPRISQRRNVKHPQVHAGASAA